MDVHLSKAVRAQEPIFQKLAQLYTHDFSEFWSGSSKGDLNADGSFDPYPMDKYWQQPHWSASLIWHGNALAGFALINDKTHSGEPVERNMAEFFVVRKYRGIGVGRRAAIMLFAEHPGSWEVAVARKNVRAFEFWRAIINSESSVADIRLLDMANDQWNGPIFRFTWRLLR
jgi:predicted acetyltransferase